MLNKVRFWTNSPWPGRTLLRSHIEPQMGATYNPWAWNFAHNRLLFVMSSNWSWGHLSCEISNVPIMCFDSSSHSGLKKIGLLLTWRLLHEMGIHADRKNDGLASFPWFKWLLSMNLNYLGGSANDDWQPTCQLLRPWLWSPFKKDPLLSNSVALQTISRIQKLHLHL